MNVRAVSSVISALILLVVIIGLWFFSTGVGEVIRVDGRNATSNNTTLTFLDINVVRDSLRILLQVQVTVIAIVISLSLAAVQLAASTYSLRLFRSFRRNPWVWNITVLYLGSIALDFSLTVLIQSTPGYEAYVIFSYLLGFFSLFLLIPYWRSMTEILSPEEIIRKLAKDIPQSSAAFQPIDDIICMSLTKYDYETARIGMQEMSKQILEIVKSHSVQALWDPKVPRGSKLHMKARESSQTVEWKVQRYCEHLERIGKLFVRKGEEELALQINKDLRRLGYTLAEKGYPIHLITGSTVFPETVKEVLETDADILETGSVLKALAAIGTEAGERRSYYVVENAIKSMSRIATSLQYEAQPVTSLAFLGRDASSEHAFAIACSIGEVCRKAVETFGKDVLLLVAENLKGVGLLYAKNKLNFATAKVTRFLFEISAEILSKEDYLDNVSDTFLYLSVLALTEIGKISHENNLEQATGEAAWGLWTVGLFASRKGLSKRMEDCAQGLAELRKLDQTNVDMGLESLKFWNKDVDSEQCFMEFMQMYLNKVAKES